MLNSADPEKSKEIGYTGYSCGTDPADPHFRFWANKHALLTPLRTNKRSSRHGTCVLMKHHIAPRPKRTALSLKGKHRTIGCVAILYSKQRGTGESCPDSPFFTVAGWRASR